MEVTKALILAVEMGAEDIRTVVADCEKELKEKYPSGNAGIVIPRALEEKRQTADLLMGWADRARKELGIEPRQ